MKSCYKLGELIRNVDVKNKDLHCNNLRGLSMTKEFRPSTSNIVGTDLSKYKIVAQKQFACDFMSTIRVHKMPIAFNTGKEEILVSPAYAVFEVVDEKIILPEYLMMWFSRTEFDRYADFRSDAAIRGGFGWNELCETSISIPCITDQYKIVFEYQAITERIALKKRINDNLEATLNAVYKEFFTVASPDELPYGWKIAPFSEIASITMGQSPEGDDCNTSGFGKALLNGPTEFGFYSPSPVQWTTTVKKHCVEGDLLFCVRGSTTGRMNWANQSYAIGRGLAAIHHKTTPNLNWFIKAMIDNNLQEILAAATGSTFPNVGKDLLNGFKVIIPDDTTLQKFGSKGYAISRLITANAKEIDTLLVFQKTLLSKLTI